ncbi:dTDP-glucose 4,6-dehydratase [Vulgatibacter incomptus]|uniref:dTDP-glucose 4,6-dehydratase n=1 Tax=Vulgatibacter incomptus TaxID=1391653 RepID=A0A0K1PFF5_9BACT|nr:dTDP-glucose 4,6-dehydratase [Vulgatibacter incomptus]
MGGDPRSDVYPGGIVDLSTSGRPGILGLESPLGAEDRLQLQRLSSSCAFSRLPGGSPGMGAISRFPVSHLLVTGGAGFIGSHLVDRLLGDGHRVTVVDDFDPFYDPSIKRRNVEPHLRSDRYSLAEIDIRDADALRRLPGEFDAIVHLAARAGVRPSILDPIGYQEVNVRGTQNVLELARERGIRQFVFASSSSVYGINPRVPWREDDHVLLPISPYASTKVSGELLGHVYSHLYGIRFVALRFFTVYGPRQRPDLAIHKFARLMLEGRPIPVYGDGSTRRDYSFVDDIVEGIVRSIAYDRSPYAVLNLGNDRTITLSELIALLEETLGVKAAVERHPDQPGDVPQTWASMDLATDALGELPRTPFPEGLRRFADWLRG